MSDNNDLPDVPEFAKAGTSPFDGIMKGMDTSMLTLSKKDRNEKLTVNELACALYEGTPHLQNLAEKLARQHGNAEALSFYGMMGEDIQNFYKGIAQQLIDHAKEWEKNVASSCVLSKKEVRRLKELKRY